ncbi:terminase small subunit [uncultured Mediterranean phage]|nr:terminase small subunit [uncultured Mediterranean phage]|tara:strand:+ start:562 stop:960 length:399 start_codon:yes stop_codon:yes gene_type:complete
MSKVDQKLDELLDIQGEIVQAEKNLPVVSSNAQDKGNDYKYSREIFYGLVERGQDAIEGILDIAKESEHPRVYEVAGQLIKTVGETTEKLIDLQAKMKELDKDNSMPDKVQNNLFVGSSAELQKLLRNNAQK